MTLDAGRKLGVSFQKGAVEKRNKNLHKKSSKKNISNVHLFGNPSSCILTIGKNRYWSLIDSGAETSLISKKMYDNLQFKPKLIRDQTRPNLQAVNGQSLSVIGRVNLTFKMNGLTLTHAFYVTNGLNRNFIFR